MTKLQDFLNSAIPAVIGARAHRARAGDLWGVEIECEGQRVDWDGNDAIIKDWRPEHDGSLRANHGNPCEWVFNGPVSYKQSVERVKKLFNYFKERKSKLVCSNRTSVHVHFNMSDKNVYQLVNMFILFTIFEGLMDRYCGEDRSGNLFCLSTRHAEGQLQWMNESCFKNMNFRNFGDDMRYCSFNVASINKYGSVEFRAMRGLDNEADVLAWMSILQEFCDYACYKMKNPVDVIQEISQETALGFMKKVFSKENVARLTKEVDEGAITRSIYDGLRLVQMLCYKIGTEFDQVRLRGRDFWNSFKDDKEPELDVDPAGFEGPRNGGRRAAPRNPFRVDHGDEEGGRLFDPFRGARERLAAERNAQAVVLGGRAGLNANPPADPALQAAIRDEAARIEARFQELRLRENGRLARGEGEDNA